MRTDTRSYTGHAGQSEALVILDSAMATEPHPRRLPVLTLVCAAIVAACSSTAEPPNPDSPGASLYTQHCARCHGADASVFEDPPRDESGVANVIEKGGTQDMPAFADVLTPDQIRTLAEYIAGLGEK